MYFILMFPKPGQRNERSKRRIQSDRFDLAIDKADEIAGVSRGAEAALELFDERASRNWSGGRGLDTHGPLALVVRSPNGWTSA